MDHLVVFWVHFIFFSGSVYGVSTRLLSVVDNLPIQRGWLRSLCVQELAPMSAGVCRGDP